jgi:hypothetical protein
VRQLEVVAVSDDGSYVLLASDENAARATHSVRIDNRLQQAIRGELDDNERRESELSPRDIQARLRAGESAAEVAKAAKVPVARVMRYAGPVLSERERIVDQAQGAVLQRSRGPELTAPLREVVDKRLAGTAGLRPETVTWDARRREDGAWVVALSYVARGGARTASWLWQPTERELSSLNSLATRLGADDAPAGAKRKRAAGPATSARSAANRPAVRRTRAKRAPSKPSAKRAGATSTATKTTAKKSATGGAAAAKATAKTSAAKRPAAKRAAPKRAVVKRSATKSAVTTPKRAATARPATRRAPKRRQAPTVVEPPVIESPARRTNGRVAVPSWSDVLLGVQAPAPTRGRRRS